MLALTTGLLRARRRLSASRLPRRDGAHCQGAAPELMLVDGSYCLYSAYYATRAADLRNAKGQPTGALLGFLQTLYRLQCDFGPSHFAVMMDTSGTGQRKKLYDQYKANRTCPGDLRDQFARAREACDAFAMPWREMEGFEADDLIHTYARTACKDDSWVNIVSVDKDLLQLASKRIQLMTDLKSSNLRDWSKWIDEDAVEKSWGVKPSQIGDLLALVGDSADNIPGVPGVGKKKGTALLQRHGDLDGIFDAARRGSVDVKGVGPKLVRSLVEHEAQARKMRELTSLLDVPGIDLASWRRDFQTPKRDSSWTETAQAFCRSQGMARLASRLEADLHKGSG